MAVFAQLKTHNEELCYQEATGPVTWRALDHVHAVLRFMRGVLGSLTVHTELMRQRAGANFTQAAQLAETIVTEKGLAFRTAHHIVGKLVRRCLEDKIAPDRVTPALVDQAAVEMTGRPLRLTPEVVRRAMDPADIVEHRRTRGGPGRREVERMLRARSLRLVREREWLARERQALASARALTDSIAAKLAKGRQPRPG
jgi:argininosuccinate lyase